MMCTDYSHPYSQWLTGLDDTLSGNHDSGPFYDISFVVRS